MDRFALRPLKLASFVAISGYSGVVLAQDAQPVAPAPAMEAPAAAPAPAPAASAEMPMGAEAPPPEPAAAKPKPPPYSLPWQLRPAVVGNVVRSDTSFAFYKDAKGKESGHTITSMLLFSYKLSDAF